MSEHYGLTSKELTAACKAFANASPKFTITQSYYQPSPWFKALHLIKVAEQVRATGYTVAQISANFKNSVSTINNLNNER